MPHVVHVYKDFWPPILGGIERSINWMIEGLRGEYEFTVLVNSRTRETRTREWNGVKIIEVGEWGRALSAPISPTFPKQMKKLSADIWHFHIPNPTGDVSWLWARPKGRVVATYHSDVVRQKWAMAVYGPFLRKFLKNCNVIMPTTPRLIDCSPVLGEFREKCHPVPLGIPLAPLEQTAASANAAREIKKSYSGQPILIFVGKLRYYKGLQFAVSAMRELEGVKLLVIGEGPEGDSLRNLADELNVNDRVEFLGELSDEEVVNYLNAADVFVMPSHLNGEAYGLSQIEAMACGVPVVCCDLPTGVPWVNQHGETGLVVPPADATALANAVKEIVSDPNKKFKMGEAALRRAQSEFSQKVMCERIGEVYKSQLSD